MRGRHLKAFALAFLRLQPSLREGRAGLKPSLKIFHILQPHFSLLVAKRVWFLLKTSDSASCLIPYSLYPEKKKSLSLSRKIITGERLTGETKATSD